MEGGLIEGLEAIKKDSPLFPCALAELVPSVEHHAAADGEERGGLEASGGQVALRWGVKKSANTFSSLHIYVCWKAFPGTGGGGSSRAQRAQIAVLLLLAPWTLARTLLVLLSPLWLCDLLPCHCPGGWMDGCSGWTPSELHPPAAMYSPSRHRCRQQLGASQPPLGVPRPPKPKRVRSRDFRGALRSRLVQWHRLQCPVACSSSH